MNVIPGYCEKHHQPWVIKCENGQWVAECPKCRAEGLLDTYVDNKTTPFMKFVEEPKRTKSEFRDYPNVNVACGMMPSEFSKDD